MTWPRSSLISAGKLTSSLAPPDEDTSQVQFTDTDEDAADLVAHVAQKSAENMRELLELHFYVSAVEVRLHSCTSCFFSEVILLKLSDGKVTEFVNDKLELEEVQRFDVDLDERRLVVGKSAWCRDDIHRH